MNSENQFETIILKILESDPQLLVAASVVLVILIAVSYTHLTLPTMWYV